MIRIGDQQSWHVDAPSNRVDNQLVVLEREGQRLLLAVGGQHHWASDISLPVGARVIDLLAESSDDPAQAVHSWDSFLRYLHHAAGISRFEQTLVFLGIRKIQVRVEVSDPRVRDFIILAIAKTKKFRLVPLDV